MSYFSANGLYANLPPLMNSNQLKINSSPWKRRRRRYDPRTRNPTIMTTVLSVKMWRPVDTEVGSCIVGAGRIFMCLYFRLQTKRYSSLILPLVSDKIKPHVSGFSYHVCVCALGFGVVHRLNFAADQIARKAAECLLRDLIKPP